MKNIFSLIISVTFSFLISNNCLGQETLKQISKEVFANGKPMFIDYLETENLKKVKTEIFNEKGELVFSMQFNPITGRPDGEFFDLKNKGFYKNGALTCKQCILIHQNQPIVNTYNSDMIETVITEGTVINGKFIGDNRVYKYDQFKVNKIDWESTRNMVAAGAWVGFRAVKTYGTGSFSKKLIQVRFYAKDGSIISEQKTKHNGKLSKVSYENGMITSIVTKDANNVTIDSISNANKIWIRNYKLIKNDCFVFIENKGAAYPYSIVEFSSKGYYVKDDTKWRDHQGKYPYQRSKPLYDYFQTGMAPLALFKDESLDLRGLVRGTFTMKPLLLESMRVDGEQLKKFHGKKGGKTGDFYLDVPVSLSQIQKFNRSITQYPQSSLEKILTWANFQVSGEGGENILSLLQSSLIDRKDETQRASLGVNVLDLNRNSQKLLAYIGDQRSFIDRHKSGAYVSKVADNGAAQGKEFILGTWTVAELKEGDVIQKAGGKEIHKVSDLLEVMGSRRPGDKLRVSVIRWVYIEARNEGSYKKKEFEIILDKTPNITEKTKWFLFFMYQNNHLGNSFKKYLNLNPKSVWGEKFRNLDIYLKGKFAGYFSTAPSLFIGDRASLNINVSNGVHYSSIKTHKDVLKEFISVTDFLKACKESIEKRETDIQRIWSWDLTTGKYREVDFDKLIKYANGPRVTRYETGKLRSRENYKDGELNGPFKSWFENGQLQQEGSYKDGKDDGLYKSWFENGQLKYEWNYKDGEFDGPYKVWYTNGQLEHDRNYKDDKDDGLYKSWFENGQLQQERSYKDGKDDGLYKSWFENGQLKQEWNYKDGEFDGPYKGWFENGQLKYEWNYKDGEFDGPFKVWYTNGQLEHDRNYKDGEFDGLMKSWYEDGQLKLKAKYKGGVQKSYKKWEKDKK